MGETWARTASASSIRLAITCPRIPEDRASINALVPVKGTVLGDMLFGHAACEDRSTSNSCGAVAIGADHHADSRMVRLSPGREAMSDMTQAMCFLAGAKLGIFTGFDKLLDRGAERGRRLR